MHSAAARGPLERHAFLPPTCPHHINLSVADTSSVIHITRDDETAMSRDPEDSVPARLRAHKEEADRLEEAGDLAGAAAELRAALALITPPAAGGTSAADGAPASASPSTEEQDEAAMLAANMAALLGYELAQLEIEQGHFAEAAAVSRSALLASPDFAHAHGTLGAALVELGEHAEAREARSFLACCA